MTMKAGRVPMTEKEAAAVETLIGDHARSDRPASITRTEPGETGPLQVQIGRRIWHVSAAGNAKEVE